MMGLVEWRWWCDDDGGGSVDVGDVAGFGSPRVYCPTLLRIAIPSSLEEVMTIFVTVREAGKLHPREMRAQGELKQLAPQGR
ncbi:hypothetical protein LWI29_013801 [Acer saccharum]|uniref:Uncharacterized protein n=1 Tax=Acer saccharum TaxID=4024 RepID=A0AA39RCJ7_ACESA|nr:hypothetical protein LWI29_013801 [Acer saccharum]